MAGKIKWSEESILRMQKNGIGAGTGADYQPWLRAEQVNSLGRARRVWSPKTGRTHHLLSDVEYNLFLALKWQQSIIDIREQFPLDRELTQEIARDLGVRHPCYPGTHIPAVMTADFVVTILTRGEKSLAAYNAKRDEEADDEISLMKLEIQRTFFEMMEAPHHVVFHSQIPIQVVKNLDWIREAILKDGEVEQRPGLLATLSARMAMELVQPKDSSHPLAAYCSQFDARNGVERGTGLRVARMLMKDRVLKADLTLASLESEPLSSFLMTAQRGQLRAIGGQ